MLTIKEIEQAYPPIAKSQRRNMLREYLQYLIIRAVFQTEESKKLTFIGGTALRMVYGNSRFSEDLDFDNFGITEEEFYSIGKYIKQSLEREGMEVELQQAGKHALRCNLKFPKILYQNELSPLVSEKILVQIDSTAQGYSYEPNIETIAQHGVSSIIRVASKSLIMAQKFYAAFTRARVLGRDFYDLVFLSSIGTIPDYNYLKQKLDIENAEQLREYVLSNIDQINFSALANDVEPFLINPDYKSNIVHFPQLIKNMELSE